MVQDGLLYLYTYTRDPTLTTQTARLLTMRAWLIGPQRRASLRDNGRGYRGSSAMGPCGHSKNSGLGSILRCGTGTGTRGVEPEPERQSSLGSPLEVNELERRPVRGNYG